MKDFVQVAVEQMANNLRALRSLNNQYNHLKRKQNQTDLGFLLRKQIWSTVTKIITSRD